MPSRESFPRTVAVAGIGFAPKKRVEALEKPAEGRASKTGSAVVRMSSEHTQQPLETETGSLEPDSTEPRSSRVNSSKTIAVVGIGFAPKKSN